MKIDTCKLKIALAPMAGITDSAFRLMNVLGGTDLVYSEMAHVNAISHGNKKTFEMLKASPFEFPYVVQLFGNDPKYFAEATKIISTRGVPVMRYKTFSDKQMRFIDKLINKPPLFPLLRKEGTIILPLRRGGARVSEGRGVYPEEIITFHNFYTHFLTFQKQLKNTNYTSYIIPSGLDINLGCPAKKVCGHGSGAALWKNPPKVKKILEAVLSNTKLPVSIKVRTAVGDTTILDLLEAIKDLPLKRVMIHGRSYQQGFLGEIDTEIIKKAIRKYPQFEYWVNGGIVDQKSALTIAKKTGCHNLGIARGTYGNPMLARIISSPYKGEVPESARGEGFIIKCVLAYIHSILNYQSKGAHGILEMRKHLCWYFKDFPGAKDWRRKLVGVEDIKDIEKILSEIANL